MSTVTEQIPTALGEELPPGWSLASIEDLVGIDGVFVDGDWVESKDQDPSGDIRLIQLADIGDGEYRNKSDRFLTHQKALELGCTFLKKDDVLVARMPDPLGRACIFPGDQKKSVTVVDVAIVRSANGEFNHRWLMYFINAPAFRRTVASLQSGSTRKRISRGNLARIALPVPPREQQNRIVAEIEKQFSRLDEAVADLKRVKANLKRYKTAVLKAAVEGKLTEDWRKQHPNIEPANKLLDRILAERREKWNGRGKYKEPSSPNSSLVPILPKGWVLATAEQCTSVITDGEHITPQRSPSGVLLLSARNVLDGRLSLADVDYVPRSEYDRIAKRLVINPGDVLLSCSGTVGRSTVAPEKLIFTLVRSVAVLKPLAGMGKYLSIALRSPGLQEQVSEKKTQTAQANIFQGKIKTLVFPLPPLTEQQNIGAEVERRLSVIDELEVTVKSNLTRAERMRQSILSAAFSGRLAVSKSEIARQANNLVAH